MGLASRKPMLPAPTESLVDSAVDDAGVSEDIGTDLSRVTDRTSHTIPDDGSPITITTKKRSSKTHKLTKANHQSQTSLLIEYFEAGKDPETGRRPSVRVKVTPSSKSKDRAGGHIVLTEAHGTRKPSHTRRISLASGSTQQVPLGSEVSSLEPLAAERRHRRAPFDIEIQQKDSDISERSASPEARYIAATSDISSMPADSMLGVPQSTILLPPPKPFEESNVSSLPAESSIMDADEASAQTGLKAPVFPKERNLSNERFPQKVIEKISNKPRTTSHSSYQRSDLSSERSLTRDAIATTYGAHPRKSGKPYREDDSVTTGTDPSLVSNSLLSAGGKSQDLRSVRSGASNSSITNPKLLQTVEDAIRRLILPELKELKKDQRQTAHHSKHAEELSDVSESSASREKLAHRSTSGGKSRRRVSKDSTEASTSRRHSGRHREHDYDSLSDASSHRRDSISSTGLEHASGKKQSRSHRAGEIAAAGLVGAGLTNAVMHQERSEESLSRHRRRKRSKSRSSRSASVAESEEIFEKHEVPPMPMRSEIDSEVTRSSLLSSNTAGTTTPTRYEVREVIRGSPQGLPSPVQTPNRRSGDLRQSLGTHHGNFSERDLGAHRASYDSHDFQHDVDRSSETERYASFSPEEPLTDSERMQQYERNLHTQHPIRRGLSPIQSVASYATTEHNRTSMMHPHSYDSLTSQDQQRKLKEEVSINSFTSASPALKKDRPRGVNFENRSEIMHQHDDVVGRDRGLTDEQYHADDYSERYRDSYASADQTVDSRRLSGLTDDTTDEHYVDKMTAGQQVTYGHGASPEYVHASGIESAVASLVAPSTVDTGRSQLSQNTVSNVHDSVSTHSLPREITPKSGSPLKEQVFLPSPESMPRTRDIALSPPQSPAESYEQMMEEKSSFHSSAQLAEHQSEESPRSEITTNPSIIQGPIGGLATGSRDHWPYNPTPPTSSQPALSRTFSSGAVDLIPEGLNISQRQTMEARAGTYVIGQANPTPPGIINKDEGYHTGDNYPSPGPKGVDDFGAYTPEDMNIPDSLDDPFVAKKNQYISGLSQGMSPLYDSATGRGMDRIKNKDIVALMDHLIVRDAQRNARDTEILITLVQSATEMRNSFEEMKRFIAEQDQMVVNTSGKQHEATRKYINGPRPQPGAAQSQRTMSSQEDLPTKRRNFFQRALPGLKSRNTQELQNIESMVMQLLTEVEALRAQQPSSTPVQQPRTTSINSAEQGRPPTDTGYEPEGQAGTSSTGDRSGFPSNNSSRQGYYNITARRTSGHRVSTVMEGDEDHEDYGASRAVDHGQTTPRAASPANVQFTNTPGGQSRTHGKSYDISNGAADTPHTSADYSAGRKQKSFASAFLPKMVSRWSKTTASTVFEDNQRSSMQPKTRSYSHVSRSGSDFDEYAHEPTAGDQNRPPSSLREEDYQYEDDRPPSPLIPSQVSDNPKYQAHRNSVNLQHPQPRQGPTGRYQSHLESEAQHYHQDEQFSPASQTSSQWESQQVQGQGQGQGHGVGRSNQTQPQQQQQHQTQRYVPQAPLSPISDAGLSETSSAMLERDGYGPGAGRTRSTGSQNSTTRGSNRIGGPRSSSKLMDDEPLVPTRPLKMSNSPSTYVDHVAAARAGSPAYDKSPVAALRSPAHSGGNVIRKPSGPRPLSSQGKKTRFTNSPLQHDSDDEGVY